MAQLVNPKNITILPFPTFWDDNISTVTEWTMGLESIELSSSWWETRNLTCRWSFWWQVRSWEGIGIVDALPSNLLMAVLVPTSIPSQLPIEGAQMLLQRAGSLGTRRASPFGLKAWLLFSKCFPSTWDCKGDFKHVNVWRWIGSLSLSLYIYIHLSM